MSNIRGYERQHFPFRKQAMAFGRGVEQFSLLSLSFASEKKIVDLGLD